MPSVSSKRTTKTVFTVFGVAIIFFLGSIGGATAAAKINGGDIAKKTIPLSALTNKAVKELKKGGPAGPAGPAGPQGPAGAAGAPAAKYWAYVNESGAVGRSSGGVTSSYITNGGTNKLYTVRFPVDVTQCAYSVTTGDTDPINQSMAVDGLVPAVTRFAADNNTVAVTLWLRNTPNGVFVTGNMGQSAFYIVVFC